MVKLWKMEHIQRLANCVRSHTPSQFCQLNLIQRYFCSGVIIPSFVIFIIYLICFWIDGLALLFDKWSERNRRFFSSPFILLAIKYSRVFVRLGHDYFYTNISISNMYIHWYVQQEQWLFNPCTHFTLFYNDADKQPHISYPYSSLHRNPIKTRTFCDFNVTCIFIWKMVLYIHNSCNSLFQN